MSWFTKQIETETAVGELTALEQCEENRAELRVLDKELAAADLAIRQHIGVNKDPRFAFVCRDGRWWSMHARVGAMFMDPVLQKLEWNFGEILRKRAANLSEGA